MIPAASRIDQAEDLPPNIVRNTISRMVKVAVGEERRRRRRRETIDEIRQAALVAMSEDGVAGMSLSDVARRIGIRPPREV